MTSLSLQYYDGISKKNSSMLELGEEFIYGLPKHISMLKIPSRWLAGDVRRAAIPAHIDHVKDIQDMMYEVLFLSYQSQRLTLERNVLNHIRMLRQFCHAQNHR